MTALLALASSFWPYILATAGVAAAFVTRWWTKRQGVAAVAQAKVDTETAVRTEIATQTQSASAQAIADADRARQAGTAAAATAAAKGDDALNQALADKGALRD